MALNSDDEMLLIRLLSKTGCNLYPYNLLLAFEFEKLHETQREELLRKTVSLLEGKEFIEILIPCIGEAVDRFCILMPRNLREYLWQRLSTLKNDKDFTEIQRCELRRITERLYQHLV
jgi:hypothetical protein